jgi:hypothetical protein
MHSQQLSRDKRNESRYADLITVLSSATFQICRALQMPQVLKLCSFLSGVVTSQKNTDITGVTLLPQSPPGKRFMLEGQRPTTGKWQEGKIGYFDTSSERHCIRLDDGEIVLANLEHANYLWKLGQQLISSQKVRLVEGVYCWRLWIRDRCPVRNCNFAP